MKWRQYLVVSSIPQHKLTKGEFITIFTSFFTESEGRKL